MTALMPSTIDGSSSFLQVTRTTIKAWMSLNLDKIPLPTTKLAALEGLKNLMNDIVTTLSPLFLIGSSSSIAGHKDSV